MALFDSPRTPLILRLALRDFRGGLSGFGVFLGCIALGVAAIAGVGSVSRSLSDGLARQGGVILGGDVSFDLIQRQANPAERAYLAGAGRLSEVAVLRAIARRDGGETALVEVKAVDTAYPSAGAAVLDPAMPVAEALADRGGVYGIAADSALLARLDMKVGDRLSIGDQTFQLRAVLVSEPDKLAAGIGFGPRVLMSEPALDATGLLQPGALVRWLCRVTLPGAAPGLPASDAAMTRFVDAAKAAFPEAGWEVRTRKNVSPQFARDLARFTQFLTLVGLTALIIGGVGVANAIRGYVDRKRPVLATLKALGATGGRVFALTLVQVLLVTAIGVAAGLVVGAALPFVAAAAFGALLPFPLAPSVYPAELAAGALYGVLTALAFSLGPLGRTHDVPVSALFRDRIEPDPGRARPRYLLMIAAASLALAGTILLLSADRRLSLIYMGATIVGFLMLRGVALLIMDVAKRLPRSRSTALRLAIANIHRPGALTPAVVLSLGLGLALLVALTLIDGNIRSQLNHTLPGETPSFFFLDVQNRQATAFADFLKTTAPDGKIEMVPMLRGRIVTVKGTPAEQVKPKADAAWALQGDRGITFAATMPAGSVLETGGWWAADYRGPPLVSMESEVADGLGLKVGDTLAVNVLGRTLTATVANTRKVNWRSFGMNFVLVFTPSTFAGAPFTDLATLTFPGGGRGAQEVALLREVARAFPMVTSLRVRDVLDAVNDVVGQLAVAIRGASSVALVAAVLVLAGALAAGQQARLYDAVVLKTLGATRWRLLAAFLLEYGLIGLATGIFGVLAGTATAYGIVARLMDLPFVWLWPQALVAALAALAVTLGLGLLSTWRILGRKPAAYLRSL
jgi:putative ABC transport system permease protein